jgi:hypothetical protein
MEPYDADWAPGTETTIDAALRSSGAQIRDVRRVVCRTSTCQALVVHHISFVLLRDPERSNEIRSMMTAITKAMESVILSDLRLQSVSVLPMVSLTSGMAEVDPSRRDELTGTLVTLTGAMPALAE